MAKHSKTLRRGRGRSRSRSRSTRRQRGGVPLFNRVTVGGRSRNRSSRRQRGGGAGVGKEVGGQPFTHP